MYLISNDALAILMVFAEAVDPIGILDAIRDLDDAPERGADWPSERVAKLMNAGLNLWHQGLIRDLIQPIGRFGDVYEITEAGWRIVEKRRAATK